MAINNKTVIWQRTVTLDELNASGVATMIEHIGIRFVHIGDDVLEATMPVDQRTRQPFGLLHGGASVVLAETLGSVAGNLAAPAGCQVAGTEISASHLRPVNNGQVRGICRAVLLGRRNQVWQIDIFDQQNRQNCTARLTTAIITQRDS